MRFFTGESVFLVAHRVENTPTSFSGGTTGRCCCPRSNWEHRWAARTQCTAFPRTPGGSVFQPSCTFHLFPSPLFCSPPRDLTLRRLTHLVTTETGPRWPAGARRVQSGGFLVFDKARPLSECINALERWARTAANAVPSINSRPLPSTCSFKNRAHVFSSGLEREGRLKMARTGLWGCCCGNLKTAHAPT